MCKSAEVRECKSTRVREDKHTKVQKRKHISAGSKYDETNPDVPLWGIRGLIYNHMTSKLLTLPLAFIALMAGAQTVQPWQDKTLSSTERATDLTGRLTLEEKTLLMMDASRPVERLGINAYNWWNEALHGVARAGVATVFPQPIGMAASFNTQAVSRVFEAVSDEARAKNTRFIEEGSRLRYQGLTMWTPTVNIFRDPRWGRGIETYGEDPWLASAMGVAVVKALQGPDTAKYNKLHACAKHFAVHSGPEWNRHSFDVASLPARDLHETYLPAFEALVKDAKVREVMCAYNRFEGAPCCGSNKLLTRILRQQWGFDGIVVADCGAIADFYKPNAHATHPDAASASADAVLMGTDLDCGSSYRALKESVNRGLIDEKEIDRSVVRLLKARFDLGEMDNLSDVSWSAIPYRVVASAQHDSIALMMARQSMTLLHNRNNFLPLKTGGLTIAVMGPNANDSVMQWGNYNGTPPHTVTILQGIRAMMGNDDSLIYEPGCDLVERTLMQSAFNHCTHNGRQGFAARYWNSPDRTLSPVAQAEVASPFRFCTSGATVFAPGVNLTGFAASYSASFTPQQSGEVIFDLFYCGQIKLWVNGNEVKSFRSNHGSRKGNYKMPVSAGETYELQLDFDYTMGDAQLNFDLGFKEPIDMAASMERVRDADIVVFVGGISPSLEGEEMGVSLPGFKGGDRTDIELPAVQREFIAALRRAGKKVVMVNCSGSPMGLAPEVEACEAILQAWYPGQAGGTAVGETLFGHINPAGRLPVTFYRDTTQLPDFEDYHMQGRTYRFMQQKPLFPFGHGLSYTTFHYGRPTLSHKRINRNQCVTLSVAVTNTGTRDGHEVVQLYLSKPDDTEGPVRTLRALERVHIPAGQTVTVTFDLGEKELQWWDDASQTMRMLPGKYVVQTGGSSSTEALKEIPLTIR